MVDDYSSFVVSHLFSIEKGITVPPPGKVWTVIPNAGPAALLAVCDC